MNDLEQLKDRMEISRDIFLTNGQWNKFKRVRNFFERLISLRGSGHIILVDGECSGEPVIKGLEMGFQSGNCFLCFVGGTYAFNKSTGAYDIPWVDCSIKELRERICVAKKINVALA